MFLLFVSILRTLTNRICSCSPLCAKGVILLLVTALAAKGMVTTDFHSFLALLGNSLVKLLFVSAVSMVAVLTMNGKMDGFLMRFQVSCPAPMLGRTQMGANSF